MNVVDEIRPRVEHFSDERSRSLLAGIVSLPAERRRPRWRRVTALTLGGVVVAGGTAYATGAVPSIVRDRFDQIGQGDDAWTAPITGERLVAEVPLSNGRTARVWYADTPGGQCVVRDMTGTVTRPEDFPVGCALWGPGQEADPRRASLWQTSADGPAVVYGDFHGVEVEIARVRVAGAGWTRTFAVHDGAYGGEVPAGSDGDRVRFVFVGRDGERVAAAVRTLVIESE